MDGGEVSEAAGWWEAVTAWLSWLFNSGWGVPVGVVLIILGAILLRWILVKMIGRSVGRVVTGVKSRYAVEDTDQLTAASPISAVRRVRRTQSLGRVFSNAVTAGITIVAVLLIVWIVFPGATGAFAIITAALGAGLGFGAQGIVKDILNGIFLAIEDQLGIGDVVTVGETVGVVEDVGIRTTQVRDVQGTLWFIRNGEIDRVGNQSHGWARAIVDYAVPVTVDVDEVRRIITEAATTLRAEPRWKHVLLEPPEVWGIQSVAPDSIVLRAVARTRTSAKDDVARELRARIKRALDAAGAAPPLVRELRVRGLELPGSERDPGDAPMGGA